MKVKIHYATVGPTGGMLTLTDDVSTMPRLPEIGEEIAIGPANQVLSRRYVVKSIDWEVQRIDAGLDAVPEYEITMHIRCRAMMTSGPAHS